jgi:hypothetical protein
MASPGSPPSKSGSEGLSSFLEGRLQLITVRGLDRAGRGGTANSGIGLAWNSLRHGLASQRAQRFAFDRRALSVAIPVFAYIWR